MLLKFNSLILLIIRCGCDSHSLFIACQTWSLYQGKLLLSPFRSCIKCLEQGCNLLMQVIHHDLELLISGRFLGYLASQGGNLCLDQSKRRGLLLATVLLAHELLH